MITPGGVDDKLAEVIFSKGPLASWAECSSMSVILLKIKDETGEAIFPAIQHGKFIP
jgi:hypothetical protein